MTTTDVRDPRTKLDELVVGEIRAWMGRRRYTQTTFAQRLGLQQQWLSRRLSGAVALTLDDVERIAEGLDVSPWVLLRGDSDQPFNSPSSRTPGRPKASRIVGAALRSLEVVAA